MDGTTAHPNIARAIRRSRHARAFQQRRRRRSAALVALLAVALAGGFIWGIGAATGNDMVEAAVAKAQSLGDLIAHRSPGARTEAQLTKFKQSRTLSRMRTAPKQHGRDIAAAPKPSLAQAAPFLMNAPLVSAEVDLEQPLPLVEVASPPPLGGILIGGPGPSAGTPGGGSPPGTPPGTQTKTPVTAPSAVPEPGTWATMLLGFGLIGWQMRRRNMAAAKVRAAA